MTYSAMYSQSNLERGENGRTSVILSLKQQAKIPQWHFCRYSRQGKCGHFILTQIKVSIWIPCWKKRVTHLQRCARQRRLCVLYIQARYCFSVTKNCLRFSFPVNHFSGHGTVIYPSLPFGNIWVTKASVNNTRITNLLQTDPILCKISGWFPPEMSNYTACGWVHTTGYLSFPFTPPGAFQQSRKFPSNVPAGQLYPRLQEPSHFVQVDDKEKKHK